VSVIMVLNDGTTYSDISGCKIVWIDDGTEDEYFEIVLKNLDLAIKRGEAEVMTTFGC
jgi:hypothetical protein